MMLIMNMFMMIILTTSTSETLTVVIDLLVAELRGARNVFFCFRENEVQFRPRAWLALLIITIENRKGATKSFSCGGTLLNKK